MLFWFLLYNKGASLAAQLVKHLPSMWETWVQFLGWEDPLEEGMATHSSILAWRIPMDRGVWPAQQSDSVIHIHIRSYSFPLWFATGYWIYFLVLQNGTLLFIHEWMLFIHPVYDSLHLLIPKLLIHLSPTPSLPWQPQLCSLWLWVCFCFINMFICVVF